MFNFFSAGAGNNDDSEVCPSGNYVTDKDEFVFATLTKKIAEEKKQQQSVTYAQKEHMKKVTEEKLRKAEARRLRREKAKSESGKTENFSEDAFASEKHIKSCNSQTQNMRLGTLHGQYENEPPELTKLRYMSRVHGYLAPIYIRGAIKHKNNPLAKLLMDEQVLNDLNGTLREHIKYAMNHVTYT
uniref:Uncharacterized protein n=1 Tax=viral metagenome TaxID=1070528 RepID=A0A2V0RKB0_9ZZZZ